MCWNSALQWGLSNALCHSEAPDLCARRLIDSHPPDKFLTTVASNIYHFAPIVVDVPALSGSQAVIKSTAQ